MSTSAETTVKLPLMGKSLQLEPLPGQDPAVRYGVVWDVCEQPGDGLGYVVEFQDSRTARLLAWMGRGGVVTECDRPLSFVMPGIPALVALRTDDKSEHGTVRARRHGSDELVEIVGFRDSFPGQVSFQPLQVKAHQGIGSPEELEKALGPYAEGKYAWRTFVAVSYLAFYLLPRLGSGRERATGTIGDVLESFTAQALPDALEGLIFRVMASEGADEVSGFERYAARMLEQAGAAELRGIAARHSIQVARLSTTRMFWMRIDEAVNDQERATLLSIEACMNRLALVELSLKASHIVTTLADCRESLCALEDQRVLARIADRSRACVDAAEADNPFATYLPANPLRGGEWDVRTRFVRACENLPVPFRLEYRFDCHVEAGILYAVVSLPSAEAFPASRWNASASRWESRQTERPAFAACYSLRLATLVAACGFGAGIGIRQVVVTGRLGSLAGEAALSLCFERMSFLNRTLPRVDMGAIARVGEHGACGKQDVQALYDALAPFEGRMDFDEQVGLRPLTPLSREFPPSRMPLAEDYRMLPAPLAHILHADRVCDLDFSSPTDEVALDEIRAAAQDAADSPLLAMARLEEIVANNPVQGLAAPDDVVAAAEAALRGSAANAPGYEVSNSEGESSFVRIAYFTSLYARCLVDKAAARDDEGFEALPGQAYLARIALARLYLESGEIEAALARAAECALLAPTSSRSLLEAAQIHLAANRSVEAARLLVQALRVCVRQQVANSLYAYLAGAFWNMGKPLEALASFTLARRFEQGDSAFDQPIGQLAHQLGLKDTPTVEEALLVLRPWNVPLAPTDEVRSLMMNLAVGFTDARIFEAAWPLVGLIGIDAGSDVLALMGNMLREGVDATDGVGLMSEDDF